MDKSIVRNEFSNPMWGLGNIQRELDSLFDGFIRPLERRRMSVEFAPSCDIEETDTHYKLSFDLPGVKKENIHLEIQDNRLSISGEKKEEKVSTEGRRHVSERYYGTFSRVFTLPTQVNRDRVEATYKDGVLYVSVPKAEAAQAKKISIGG